MTPQGAVAPHLRSSPPSLNEEKTRTLSLPHAIHNRRGVTHPFGEGDSSEARSALSAPLLRKVQFWRFCDFRGIFRGFLGVFVAKIGVLTQNLKIASIQKIPEFPRAAPSHDASFSRRRKVAPNTTSAKQKALRVGQRRSQVQKCAARLICRTRQEKGRRNSTFSVLKFIKIHFLAAF